MNNEPSRKAEPVAWMSQGGDVSRSKDYFEEMGFKDLIPLYTHPVKELTDEEILNVLKKIADNNEYVYSLYEDFSEVEFSKVGIFEFARAIMKRCGIISGTDK